MKAIEKLTKYEQEIAQKKYISNILNWELRTKAPKDTKLTLIDLQAQVDVEVFNLITNPQHKELLLASLDNKDELTEVEERYIKKLLKDYELFKKVPSAFYQEYQKLCNVANDIWEKAKEENNYELFKPYLAQIIEMTKEYYRYMYEDGDLYDAMLNTYEEGMTSAVIDGLFKRIKEALIPLVQKVKKDDKTTYKQEYSESDLLTCAHFLLSYIGFDMNRGALGIYPHGYTERLDKNDIRIAFKHTDLPLDFVSTIIHEGGHGIFEQNVGRNSALISNIGVDGLFGLHESQSRFYENILGRNINFWVPIYDQVKQLLKLDLTLEEFSHCLNQIHLGFIRTQADELTYCLHIIIRYELEREIFSGQLTVDELPKAWNAKVKEYLGIDVPNDSEGLMQDVHWSQGDFGYFPSYLLGNIYGGMLKEQIESDLGKIDDLLREGKIKDITKYLIDNIYQYGSAYTSKEVMERVCHKEISAEPIIRYFYEKYDI